MLQPYFMKRIYLVIFFLAVNYYSNSQKPIVKNLVFEGAGMRGIAYCGVLKELEEQQLMSSIQKVGGTSAGAIMALTVSLGYSSNEISTIIGSTNFRKFNDGRFLLFGGINRIRKYFGWYRGKRFENWLKPIIAGKTGEADITFRQLHEKGFRDLYITGTCLNKQQLIIFSHETYPEMKVKDAVRISMSIPFYFEAVFLDSTGKVIHHPKQKQGLDVMVDGGFTGNYPIRLFDSSHIVNPHTLGFRIDSDEQIKMDREGKKLANRPVENINQFVTAFYTMVMENLNRQPLTAEDWRRTISISDGDISPRIRRLKNKEIDQLIHNGKNAMKTYWKEK